MLHPVDGERERERGCVRVHVRVRTDGGVEWPNAITLQIILFFPREAQRQKSSGTLTSVALTAMSRDRCGFREVKGQGRISGF